MIIGFYICIQMLQLYTRRSELSASISLWSEEKTITKEITHRTAKELLKNFQTNLNDGIPISEELWKSLSKQAKKVLLKSTEYSREGAGESTEFVDPEE